ncbi:MULTISPECIES: hypothetical protein [Amycolatopsis]|uniref:Immunity protein 35 domain-containing protein n=1 Tax=Amycolatopsis albidoflavus TaxID=102226 RepID=A0ABW5HS93_9PSEU
MTALDEVFDKLAGKFRAISLMDLPHIPPAMLYTRALDDLYMESVLVRAEDDSTAYRIRVDESDASVYGTGGLVWASEGSLVDVFGELMSLPHPSSPNAPRLVIPKPSSLWLPESARQ